MTNGAYMTDDITIIKYGGEDSWNEPLATTEIDVKGKIEYKTRLVRNVAGEEVVSSAKILLPEKIDAVMYRDLMHEDVLKFDGIKHAIIAIGKPKAFSSTFIFKYEVFVA